MINAKSNNMKEVVKTAVRFVATILFLVLIGFIGYYFGFLQAVYKILMPNALSRLGLITLSVVLGIAAFFSPCAFTVLPAYLSHYLTAKETKSTSPLWSAAKLGMLAALGIILVNMLIGLVIASLGAATPFAKDPRQDIPLILGIRAGIGFLIAFLGVMTLTHRTLPLSFLQEWLRKKSTSRSMFMYGVFYNAAAVGCTGPIMLGLLLYAFSTGSFSAALAAFATFSLTMGILMVLLTTLTGIFKAQITEKLARATPVITYIAGIIMLIVGLSIAFLTLEGNNTFVRLFFKFLE